MSLTKVSLAGNSLIIPEQGEFAGNDLIILAHGEFV
jgi:hypothetical protein